MQADFDTLVVGGGVVGLSVAYGLVRAGDTVCVLDGQDDALRASRGNFGLIWVQGKGLGNPDYAHWTMQAAQRWGAFAADLEALTGVDVELRQPGGLTVGVDDDALTASSRKLDALGTALGIAYPYERLDLQALRERIPEIGPAVAGAIYCPLDGHVSPLRTLRALTQGFRALGGRHESGVQVQQIECLDSAFRVQAGDRRYHARRVVLAAGLSNQALALQVGLDIPVKPIRGQLLVSERVAPFLNYPCHDVRQTGEGVVQIGGSKEDVGVDDGTTIEVMARIAAHAVRCFPLLSDVNMVRTWGALRVMSPDGYPIYQESARCPGAFAVTCHSGITLAPVHAGPLADWIRTGVRPMHIESFKADRFHVQTH
ncbi:FAD-binding oxidoreductase [Bordetella sp. N]|uniref:NAD(P)/FAD-dependent oxidoreductase n=1 Tax=Bordetella sp. N TaxID=1746199 RepID=UPI00070AFD29|nr:FAD-dependent oxidoreductase [Bordetella sp. N]ALM83330.1 FAD-dependent oxidoreductase [Bordetella sp. N]